MHSFRKILQCVRLEYLEWIINPRQMIMAVLIIFNYTLAVKPLVERSIQMDKKINILEPFVAVGSSGMVLLILPIVFYILISDYPADKGNAILRISRIGRTNWLIVQFINLSLVIITYLIVVALGTIVPIGRCCTITHQWSTVVIDYAKLFPELSESYELLPENLYYQIENPVIAALHTYVLLFLYLFLIGELLILASIVNKRKLGNLFSVFLITGGAALCSIHSQWMWLFPMSHTVVWLHFTKFLRKEVLPLYVSYFIFIISCTVLCIISFLILKRYNFTNQEE